MSKTDNFDKRPMASLLWGLALIVLVPLTLPFFLLMKIGASFLNFRDRKGLS